MLKLNIVFIKSTNKKENCLNTLYSRILEFFFFFFVQFKDESPSANSDFHTRIYLENMISKH